MKKSIAIVLGFVAIFSLSACKKERITANGNIISETRDVGQFTGVSSSGSAPVYVNYGTEYKVVLRGSSNIIPYFTTRVVNNVLHLSFEHVNIHRDDIKIMITMPVFRKALLSGSGKIEIKGDFPSQSKIDVSISGSGDIEIENNVYAERTNIDVSGSGKVDFEKLNVKIAEINISGSGNVKLQVEERLKAKISGSGKIYYRGNPIIQQDISGSGKVIQF